MTIFAFRSGAMLASAAALSLVATPALADRGWGGHRHHDSDDTGAWVIGGIIGIGMIAALASAASKGKRDREARERDEGYDRGDDYRGESYGREDYRYGNRSDEDRGSYSASPRDIDGAVDSCVSEVERGSAQVESVDSVNRDGAGWRISGRGEGGEPFECRIDGNGRIRSVSIDGHAVI